MDFSGLVKGVQDFWDFIWPPMLCLLALVGITFFVAPLTSGRIRSGLLGLKPTDRDQIQFVKVSKRFGFDKLLPIICAFFLIFLLDLVRNVVVMGGQALPPVISYSPSGILLENSDWSTVQCLWQSKVESLHKQKQAALKPETAQKNGVMSNSTQDDKDQELYNDPRVLEVGFEDVSQLIEQSVAEAKIEHEDAESVRSLHYAEERSGTAHMIFSGLKFLFLYTLVLSCFEIRISPVQRHVAMRATIMLILIMAGSLGFFLRYIKTVEAEEASKIHVTQVYPAKGSLDCDIPDSDREAVNSLYTRMVTSEKASSKKWWSLKFPSIRPILWSWRQLSEDHPGPFYAP